MKRIAWALVLGSLWACSGEPQRIPPKASLTAIAVETTDLMVIVGRDATFAATGMYDDGTTEVLTDDVEWTVDDDDVAVIIGAGMIDTRAVGTVNVVATLGDISGSLLVTVIPTPIRSIEIDPETVTIQESETQRFTATATFRDGTTMDVTATIPWASSDESIATVEAGLARGFLAGRVDISATDPMTSVKGIGVLTVREPTIEDIDILPPSITIAIGQTQRLSAIADLSNGEIRDITAEVEWSSMVLTTATVDTEPMTAGTVTGVAAGSTQIVARHTRSNSRATASVTVTPAVIESIAVSPRTRSIGLGETAFLSAVASLSDGSSADVTNTVDWRSSAAGVATVSNQALEQGTVRAVTVGTATISAFDPTTGVDSGADSAVVTITPAVLLRLEVLPRTAQVAAGLTQVFTARGVYSDGSIRDFTASVTWSSSAPNIATVDATGLVTTIAAGNVTIGVTDPVSGMTSGPNSAALEVLPPGLLSIAVSPAVGVVVEGLTRQLTATGRYTDGVDRNITTAVRWFSNNTAVSVAANGLARGIRSGTATVTASHQATQVSSNTTNENGVLTVEALRLVSIAVTPTAVALPVGATAVFTAMGTFNDASTADLTNTVEWSTLQTSVATVGTAGNQVGVVRAVGGGATIVDARDPATGVRAAVGGTPGGVNVLPNVTLTSLSIMPETPTVNLNSVRQLEAIGLFSNGSSHLMTDVVNWTSTATAVASVSNADGTRGEVNGRMIGTASVSATHVPTAITTAMPSRVTVQVGTIGRSWNGPTVSVDGTSIYGRSVGSVTFTAADFGPTATIVDVDIAINFLKTNGSCAFPAAGNAFHNETNFRIQSGTGTRVILAPPGTWSGATTVSPVTVTFDQSAAARPTGTPVTGTFRPNVGNLNTLNGTSPIGTWILQAGDSAGGDPLCVIGYTVTVTAQ